ncbi:MAG: hypothetical protein P8I82_02140 [Flavobacteriales bacterium]|nr:hypothetical protein [Flavobacteriales bacterium]
MIVIAFSIFAFVFYDYVVSKYSFSNLLKREEYKGVVLRKYIGEIQGREEDIIEISKEDKWITSQMDRLLSYEISKGLYEFIQVGDSIVKLSNKSMMYIFRDGEEVYKFNYVKFNELESKKRLSNFK